eukprot:5371322-Pyramimonas_sp.AAC.1
MEDKKPPDEQAEERMAEQPRQCYEDVDCPDHCCKACRDSYDRSDSGDMSTHDDAIASKMIPHKQPDQNCKKRSPRNWRFLVPERQSRQGSLKHQLCTPSSTI